MKRFVFYCGVLFLAGCVHAQRPYSFAAPDSNPDMIAAVVRTLANAGLEAKQVDAQNGVVQTAWQDTGWGYGQVGNVQATLVRRYTVTLAPQASSKMVQVRVDLKQCPQGGFEIADFEVRGSCNALDGLIDREQEKLDSLGATLEQALTGRAPGTASAK